MSATPDKVIDRDCILKFGVGEVAGLPRAGVGGIVVGQFAQLGRDAGVERRC
jgi:hypothetical protein